MAVVIAVLGGALGGALLTQLATVLRGRAERRSRHRSQARLLHEDFLHQQSTVARAYYRSPAAGSWWEPEEYLKPAADDEVYADVLGALGEREFIAVASARGWMDYFRRVGAADKLKPPGQQTPPSRAQLCDVYRKLATARYALTPIGHFRYRPHEHEAMAGSHAPDSSLTVSASAAKTGLLRAPREQVIAPVPGIGPDVIQETLDA
jgi:hypothetical protein